MVLAAASQVVDMDCFIKFHLVMEELLEHWDEAQHVNDGVAVACT